MVVIVGHDAVLAGQPSVLVVPIYDAPPPTHVDPIVYDDGGSALGAVQTQRVGQVDRAALTSSVGRLAPASVEAVDIALRAVLDL
jgi:mRNA-degrading endonuclease toxin of MazEF toxin-antitoxin module